jgi:hypothetical protein
VRRPILGSRVGLDLDDAPDAQASCALANEQRPEEAGRRLADGSREEASQVDDEPQRYFSRRSDGVIPPTIAKKSGSSEARNRSTTWDEL